MKEIAIDEIKIRHWNRRIVAPKREKLQAALKSLKEKEQALEEAMKQLQKLQEKLKKLQEMYDAKMKEKEELIKLASSWIIVSIWIPISKLKLYERLVASAVPLPYSFICTDLCFGRKFRLLAI